MQQPASRPGQVFGRRVKELRRAGPFRSAEALARAVTERGLKINRAAVTNIENGHRESVTVDEVYAFALALNTSPTTLLVDSADWGALQQIGDRAETGAAVRGWWRGEPIDPGSGGENVLGFYNQADRDDQFKFKTSSAPGVAQAEPRREHAAISR